MSDFLFVAQEMLDGWMMSGKIDFSGHVMRIAGDARSYVLEPAVRFVRIVGEGDDGAGLIGKVKTLAQVEALGGEHYADSVILGEVAYEVQNGFVARVSLPEDAAPPEHAVAEGVAEGEAPPASRAAPAVSAEGTPGGAGAPGPAPPPPASPAGDPSRAPAAAVSSSDPAPGVDERRDAPEGAGDDVDLLTDFLLKNLR
jgi:hypothetical protein